MAGVVVYGGDTRRDDDGCLVLDRPESCERVLGLSLVVEGLLEDEVRVQGAAGHGSLVIGMAYRREAQASPHALLVVESQLVYSGGDYVPVGSEVAGVKLARRRGRVFLLRDQLLLLDSLLLTLVLARRLVRVLGRPVAVALRVLLLELARVEQHESGELDRAPGGVDGPVEALGHDVGDEAAVIQVRVGQDDGVEARRVVGQWHVVAHHLLRAALEHPAIDEHPGTFGGQQELRSGDGVGRPKEVDFHAPILPPQR